MHYVCIICAAKGLCVAREGICRETIKGRRVRGEWYVNSSFKPRGAEEVGLPMTTRGGKIK